MLDGFLDTLGSVGVFVICARMIVHFRPKEADEKYMKLLVSIMVLLQLLLPLRGQFTHEKIEFELTWEEIKATVEEATNGGMEQGDEMSVETIQVEPIKKISLEE